MSSVLPSAPVTLTHAYLHYLDDLRWLSAYATHCPLALADPDQPPTGWSYSLPGDPGHAGDVERDDSDEWIHQALIVLWHRQTGRITGQFLWRVTWTRSAGWIDRWYARVLTQPWQPYPSDFLRDIRTPLIQGQPFVGLP